MFQSELLLEAVLQQLFATCEATRTLHNFKSTRETQGEMQNCHSWAVDICIISLGAAIWALYEHVLMGLKELVGPTLSMVDDTSEDEAPLCKHCRTHNNEESGEDQSLSNDEPDSSILDVALAHGKGCGASKSGNDKPWDPFNKADFQATQNAGFSRPSL